MDNFSDEWYQAFCEQMEELDKIRLNINIQQLRIRAMLDEIKQGVDREYSKKYEQQEAAEGREDMRNKR